MSWIGVARVDFATCGSTNDEAARLARAGARHGTIVLAEAQTAGRGRDGRTWTSPAGGLYLSIVMRPALALADVPALTLAIGVACCDTARAFGADAHLKWPNDVLVAGEKLAGVLVEAHSQGGRVDAVIVGIGMNLVASGELAPHAVALGDVSLASRDMRPASSTAEGRCGPIDRHAVLARMLEEVERWTDRYIAIGLPAIVPAWHERMARGLAARAGAITGEALGLDADGALLLRDGAGTVHRVRSGDVEVVRT